MKQLERLRVLLESASERVDESVWVPTYGREKETDPVEIDGSYMQRLVAARVGWLAEVVAGIAARVLSIKDGSQYEYSSVKRVAPWEYAGADYNFVSRVGTGSIEFRLVSKGDSYPQAVSVNSGEKNRVPIGSVAVAYTARDDSIVTKTFMFDAGTKPAELATAILGFIG
jgi:hypothetical protein